MMNIVRRFCCTVGVLAALVATAPANAQERWEKTIQGFEAQDKVNPPPQGAILFLGSSSIVRWDLDKYFPDLKTINRGFGGSDISDSVYFADRILIPYKPRIVVVFAGGNDLGRGKKALEVAGDFQKLTEKTWAVLPETRFVVLGVKSSVRRWEIMDEIRKTNRFIHAYADEDPRIVYVDTDTTLLGADFKPRPELFVEDGLHMSPAGYEIWTRLVRPLLGED